MAKKKEESPLEIQLREMQERNTRLAEAVLDVQKRLADGMVRAAEQWEIVSIAFSEATDSTCRMAEAIEPLVEAMKD